MMLGGGGRKGNKEGDGGKGHGSPSERHLESEEGSLRGERGWGWGRGDEGVTDRNGSHHGVLK